MAAKATDKLRVLHVIPSLSSVHGGPTQAMLMMERHLPVQGIEVSVLATDDDGPGRHMSLATFASENTYCKRIILRKRSEFYKVAPAAAPWLWRHIESFDVVHVHALFSFLSTLAASIAAARGVPYIMRPLGTLSSYGVRQRRPWLKRVSLALIEKRLLRRAAAVHFTTEAEQREAQALGIAMTGVVIPLGVEPPAEGNRQAALQRHPQLNGKIVLLFLSRLDPIKNLESLLRAFSSLPQHERLHLVIAGSGDAAYVAELHKLAETLGIESAITWAGHVQGAAKADLLAVADIFVLPSFSENFGIAAVEAMMAGLPCVLGEGVAVATAAARDGAAHVCKPQPQAIARALHPLIADADLRAAMGAAAKAHAAAEYAPQVMAQRLAALYRAVARGESLEQFAKTDMA